MTGGSNSWKRMVIPPDLPMSEALRLLDDLATRILIVADSRDRLVGTVTDGDVRRAILRGQQISDSVAKVMNPQPASVLNGTPLMTAHQTMSRISIDALPVVSRDGVLEDVLLARRSPSGAIRPNKAVIMAGGRGTRLGSLTDTTPKPLIRVGGVPIAEAIVRRLISDGFHDICLAVHYRSDAFIEHFGDGEEFGANITYLVEEQPLGTAGALGQLGEVRDSVLVVNGDVITDGSYCALLDAHEASGNAVTIGAALYESALPYGVITQELGRVVSIEEKPLRRELVLAGVSILSSPVIGVISPNTRLDMTDLIHDLIASGQPVGLAMVGTYWLDVGTPDALRQGRAEHFGGPIS